MDRSDVCRLLASKDPELGGFCLGLDPEDPSRIERVAWLALWLRDPGESPIPEGMMENSKDESEARFDALLKACSFFLDQEAPSDDANRDEEICSEICLWARDHYDRHGYWGLKPLGWLKKICHRNVRSYGRLQVEEQPFLEALEGDRVPNENERVLALHIPATGPLLPSDVDESLVQIRESYAEKEIRFLTCHSWLLAPELEKVLREDSNILSFQQRFEIIRDSEDEGQALERVFGADDKTANNDLPQENDLQRSMVKAREDGKKFGIALGVIPF